MVLQSLFGVLAPLAQTFAFIRKPRAAFFNYAIVSSEIQQIAFARNTFAVHDIELSLAKRGRDLVLGDFDLGAIADNALGVFYGADAANVEPKRSIELERAATARRLGIAEHHANLN